MGATKIVEFNDLHFGIRNGDQVALEAVKRWCKFAISVVVEEQPDFIVFNGDTFDNRRCIHSLSAFVAKNFVHDLGHAAPDAKILISVGNHDAFYRDSQLQVSSVMAVFNGMRGVDVVYHPELYEEEKFAIIPWVNKENYDQCLSLLANLSDNDFDGVIFTHMDIVGAKLSERIVLPDGFETNIFPKKATIINGHIHYPSAMGNIINVGVQYELARYVMGNECRFPIIEIGEDVSVRFVTYNDKTYIHIDDIEKYGDLSGRVVVVTNDDLGTEGVEKLIEKAKSAGATIDFTAKRNKKELKDADAEVPNFENYLKKMGDLWESTRVYIVNTVKDKKKAKAVSHIIERAMQ